MTGSAFNFDTSPSAHNSTIDFDTDVSGSLSLADLVLYNLSAGNDTILANRGRDRVYGGDGDDVIFARDGRRDTLYGEAGNDSASFDAGPGVLDLVDGIETIL